MASYATTGTTTLFGGNLASDVSSECSRCLESVGHGRRTSPQRGHFHHAPPPPPQQHAQEWQSPPGEWKELTATVRENEKREANRHDRLMTKLETLIDLYAGAQYQHHASPPSSDPTVISVSPIRAAPIQRDPRHISPPRHRMYEVMETRAVAKKKKTKKKRSPPVADSLVMYEADQSELLRQVVSMEDVARSLQADKEHLQRHNDVLASENVQFRERLLSADTALNKLRTLKNQISTLNSLQTKGTDLHRKNTRTLGKVQTSVDGLAKKWAPKTPRLKAPPTQQRLY
eukprot:TRINITY_DN7401_c1_g1_i1.p1 TRINITY_DN7401_c1_g1~~TRINITY_DN7401_c1_g1_i1.p1  ORF type:complete len:288 (+),score=62.27 TRINITY_DN7401_c1_g1_i1:49-912(+)